VEVGGGIRAGRRTAHAHPAGRSGGVEGAAPRCLADVVDHYVCATAGQLLYAGWDVVGVVVESLVGAEFPRALQLGGARGSDDYPAA